MKVWGRRIGNVLLALCALVALAGWAFAAQGCAHMSPAEREAMITSVSMGQECVAQPAVECPWTAGPEAFKDCVAMRALPCGVEKIGSLLAVGLQYAWEHIGVRLAAPPIRETPYPRRAVTCIDAIDANAVALHCERRHPSLCVSEAVGRCLELAAEGDLASGEPGPGGLMAPPAQDGD